MAIVEKLKPRVTEGRLLMDLLGAEGKCRDAGVVVEDGEEVQVHVCRGGAVFWL